MDARVDVVTETTIHRPRSIVAAFSADPTNAPTWYDNIRAAVWQTEPPLRVGTRVAFEARFLGRTLAYTYEVFDYVEGVQLRMRTEEGPFPMETTYAWVEPTAGTTRMTLRNRGEPSGFSKLTSPFMRAAMRRANAKDLAKLKSILERD